MLKWFLTVVLIVLTLSAAGGAIYWASIDLPTECRDSGAEHQNKTGEQGVSAEKKTALGHLIPTQDSNTQAPKPSHYYECLLAEYTLQLAKFTKGLAVSAIFLVIVTLGLVVFAALTFFHDKTAAAHDREAERAHVSGGAMQLQQGGIAVQMILTINNYGKTPAFIGTIAAAICSKNDLSGRTVAWQKTEWKGYIYGPVAGKLTDVTLPFEAGKVTIGRIWYQDIFKNCHSFGFALNTDDGTAVSAPAYWKERDECDLGPADPNRTPQT